MKKPRIKRTHRNNFKKSRTQKFDRKYYSKEDIFLSRMASIMKLSLGEVKHIFYQRARTTIRLNHLMGDPKKTYKVLTQTKAWELQEIKGFKDTYFVNNKDKKEISQTDEYRDGKFYIQDLASIMSVYILDPKENEKILDMCAAPGSKTTLISAMTNNKANIVANDIDIPRISKLNNVLHQFGSNGVKVTTIDGKIFGKMYPDHFDRVLLDAPCSGEGRIYLAGPKPLRLWTIKRVNALVNIQKDLIESAFKTLKKGGTLIYSTCTLEPDENEGVVTYLLNTYKNAKVEDITFVDDLEPLINNNIKAGITKWSGNTYHPDLKKSLRTIPSPEMMGFYIVKLTKI
jgi:16S rRNA (cytosine1407-C5)-methyltransferase